MTRAGQQNSFDGFFRSVLVDLPQKTSMKRSGQNHDNSRMIGDDSSASAFNRGSKHASHVINETLPSILQSVIAISNPTNYNPNSNEVSDQIFQREYMDRYTPDSGFQHSPDNLNELINNLSTKDNLLYAGNIISNKLEAGKIGRAQKHLESYIHPTFNMKYKNKLDTESSTQPFKEYGLEKVGLLPVADEQNNFMHEDDYYNPKKLSVLHTRQHFLSDHKLLAVKPSYDKLRGTLFFPGSRSRYGSSIHKGIIRGNFTLLNYAHYNYVTYIMIQMYILNSNTETTHSFLGWPWMEVVKNRISLLNGESKWWTLSCWGKYTEIWQITWQPQAEKSSPFKLRV